MTHQYKKLLVTMKMWMQFNVMPRKLRDEAIRTRQKSYFEELLNAENAREPLEQVSVVEGPENEITRK